MPPPPFADLVEWCLQARKKKQAYIGENVWNTAKKCVKFACNYFKSSSAPDHLWFCPPPAPIPNLPPPLIMALCPGEFCLVAFCPWPILFLHMILWYNIITAFYTQVTIKVRQNPILDILRRSGSSPTPKLCGGLTLLAAVTVASDRETTTRLDVVMKMWTWLQITDWNQLTLSGECVHLETFGTKILCQSQDVCHDCWLSGTSNVYPRTFTVKLTEF